MPTERLYYHDSYRTHFAARILRQLMWEGQPAVVLDQTAFYPTSGGQPHDTGSLNGIEVINVIEQDDDILHILTTPLMGEQAVGEIHWSRRFDHMQQHAGQHILSRAFEEVYNGDTVGFHLGSDVSTVDIEIPAVTLENILHLEDLVNQVIWRNTPIHTLFPNSAELATLSLRKPPKKTDNVRIVQIGDWDCCACGGTHPATTGEIGILVIRRWEKHRAGIRVEFACGQRVLRDYRQKNRAISELMSLTSMPEENVTTAVQRLLQHNITLQKTTSDLTDQLLTLEAATLYQAVADNDVRIIAQDFESRTQFELKSLAIKLTSHPQTVALLGSSDGTRCQFVFHRSTDLPFHMGHILQQVLPVVDGKGGGSPQSAQGGGANPHGLADAIATALNLITQQQR